jgi:hypothetical protein
MGSRTSGRLTDYSGVKNSNGTGGTSGVDRCGQSFDCSLEDVAQCDYFTAHAAVPPVGTELTLVLERRIFAVAPDGLKVGALPTAYNYIAACIKAGYSYVGAVTASGTTPMPFVSAVFTPK